MTIKERFEKHRRDAVICCPEDCLCWDVEIMAAQLAEKDNTPDFARGFRAGQDSIRRKNESGCCCKFDELTGEILSCCATHKEYVEIALAEKEREMEANISDLLIAKNEQIAALTAERDRLKRFWDTYAREVDKLAFEAQEEALEGAGDEEIVSLKESFRISSQLNEGLEERVAELKAERDGCRNGQQQMQEINFSLQNVIEKYANERKELFAKIESVNSTWKLVADKLTAENKRLREALENLVNALKAVHDDPEYQCVWTLYQSHFPTGYRGRKYTEQFDEAKETLRGKADTP